MKFAIRSPLPAALTALLLCACATRAPEPAGPDTQQPEAQAGSGRPVLMERAKPKPPEQTGQPGAEAGVPAGPQVEGQPAVAGAQPAQQLATAPQPQFASTAGGTQLSFIDTDIATVVASVLGEVLGQQYVIDPRVKGTMTLQSTGVVSPADLFASLEVALRLQDVAMVGSDKGYRIVPIRDAPRQVARIRTPESKGLPGYGIEVVPLQYIAAGEMEKVLQPIASPGSVLRVDDTRNVLLIAGTTQERATLVDMIRVFDTDQMGGMSFTWIQLEHVEAKVLVKELTDVLTNVRSSLASIVKIIPMSRLNAILVLSPQPQYLDQVGAWVRRLDVPSTAPERRIYVYDVQNGKASDIATALRTVLGEAGVDTAPELDNSPAPPTARTGAMRAETAAGSGWSTGGLRVVPSDENNSLLVLASPSEYNVVEGALRKLDVPPRQVLIEATLAEVTLNDQLRFGIQWFSDFGNGNVTLSQTAGGGVLSQFPGFSYVYTGSTRTDAVLNALETMTNVKVVSSPKLIVLNNHTAMLQVGDQVPVVSQSSVSTGTPGAPIVNTVQMRDTGVILSVTPRVNKGGLVLMEVEQEVSEVVPTTTSGIDSPTIQQRRLASTVAVHSGQTIALGGLIRETTNDNRSGLPWIQRIPLLGRLFGSSDVGKRRTELIILLTPRVVRDLGDTRELTDYLREQFKTLKPTIK